MSQPRVPKCYLKGLIPPCWSPNPPHAPCHHLSPKPTPCPSPVSPSATLKVPFHYAGPLNPPHVPAPCPHLSPKPTPCPSPVSPSVTLKVSPKPTPCPSPVSPSATLKVSFHHAGHSSLNHQHPDWWFCWSYLCGSKWCFLVLSDPVVLSDPNPLVLSNPPTIWDDFRWLRWLQWWKVGTRSPVVWGLFNAQDWHRMGRICWICFFWVRQCWGMRLRKNPNQPYLPNDIARCCGTVIFHLALHIHSTVVRMSVWSDSRQQMISDILISVVFWRLRKSFNFLREMRAKLIGQPTYAIIRSRCSGGRKKWPARSCCGTFAGNGAVSGWRDLSAISAACSMWVTEYRLPGISRTCRQWSNSWIWVPRCVSLNSCKVYIGSIGHWNMD